MDVFEAVKRDLDGRNALGAAAHEGRPLLAGARDRDWLLELYQELLDACVYVKAEMIRRDQDAGY